jgi:uncharacterized protein (TIGR00266 family)
MHCSDPPNYKLTSPRTTLQMDIGGAAAQPYVLVVGPSPGQFRRTLCVVLRAIAQRCPTRSGRFARQSALAVSPLRADDGRSATLLHPTRARDRLPASPLLGPAPSTDASKMQVTIEHGPSFAWARCKLAAGEAVRAEAGAMVSMSASIDIETKMQGGLLGALARKVLSSESFFQNTFTAARGPGEVTFAAAMMGDIRQREMAGDALLLTSGCYLASATTVDVSTKWGGMKSFFAKEGLFLLRIEGRGPLLFSCYGALVEVDVPPAGYVVDTGHVVAFEPTLDYEVRKVGGLKSLLFSGEGLVCQFSGRGRLWLQTRSLDAFIGAIVPFLPTRSSN